MIQVPQKSGDLDQYLVNLKATNTLQTSKRLQSNHPKSAPGGLQSVPIEIKDEFKLVNFLEGQDQTQLFTNQVIFFPCVSINLTKLRISILQNLVKKNSGISYNSDTINKQKFLDAVYNGQGYLVVSRDVKENQVQTYLLKIGLCFQQLQHNIISSEWICESITRHKMQDPKEYITFPLNQDKDYYKQVELEDSSTQILEKDLQQYQMYEEQELQTEFDPQFIYFQIPEESKDKILKKYKKSVKRMLKLYRWVLNYQYDPRFQTYHESYLEDEEDNADDDETFPLFDLKGLKKEEYQPEIQVKYDDECCITDVKQVEPKQASIFDGIDIPKELINIPVLVKPSPMSDMSRVYNAGQKRKWEIWEQKKSRFVCEAGSQDVNHNIHITKHLEQLLQCYTNDRDKGRTIAYTKAISFLKALPFRIKSEDDVKQMPTIGKKINEKIIEIIQTGSLQKADNLSALEKNQVLDIFSKVWGVGPSTAAMFFFKGLRTLDDLRERQDLLSKNQLIGLKYVVEFKQRIPREECTEIITIIKDKIEQVADISDVYEAIACGSYRRGKPDCGDVDILITRKDGKNPQGFLQQVVTELEKILLTDHLIPPKQSSNGTVNYMGVGQLRPDLPHRRIDMKYYPREQFGYAVLYFTGSDQFNRSMRLFALKKGYLLSDHGLYNTYKENKIKQVLSANKMTIPCYTEEAVFKVLNLSYKRPEERSV